VSLISSKFTRPISREKSFRFLKKIFFILFIPLNLFVSFSFASDTEISVDNFENFKSQHAGKNWLVVVWSLDCPPCFDELETIARLSRVDDSLPIVLLNADDAAETTQERRQVIKEFDLEKLNNFYFDSRQAGALKQRLDRSWHGELPRSYFVSKQGAWRGRSGVIKEEHIKLWLTN
jgi:thiol-disulfide isomerase/thioredoxin